MENYIQSYCRWASRYTDTPEVFHKYAAMWAVGCAAHKLFFRLGTQRIFPNLWCLLLAPSSKFHKTTSIRISETILRAALPYFILPVEFSQEKLIELLAAKPQGTFVMSEMPAFLGFLQREYLSGTKELLTDLYDSPPIYERKLKSAEYRIERPFVAMMSAGTINWLVHKLREEDIMGGFFSRFFLVPVFEKEKSIALPPSPSPGEVNPFIQRLAAISTLSGEVSMDAGAREMYEIFYQGQEKRDRPPLFDAALERLNVTVLKFAIIEAAAQMKTAVERSEISSAIGAAEWIALNMLKIYERDLMFSPFEKKRKKVLDSLRSGRKTRSDLLRITRMPTMEFDRVIQSLLEADMITIVVDRATKKPVTTYVLQDSHAEQDL